MSVATKQNAVVLYQGDRNPTSSNSRANRVALVEHILINRYTALRGQSLDFFEIDLTIAPAVGTHTAIGLDTRFTFQQGWGAPVQLRVRLSLSGQDGAEILLDVNNLWLSMEAWMQTLVQPDPIFDAVRHQDAHSRWWSFNGKIFRIHKLPRELRDMIYTYALFPSGDRTVLPFRGLLRNTKCFYLEPHHNVGVLVLSRKDNQEAAAIIYGTGKFIFFVRQSLERFLFRTSKKTLDLLRHVELRMTHLEYIEMFGGLIRFKTSRRSNRPPERLLGCVETHKLNSLHNLTKLELHITHPAQVLPDLPLQSQDNLDFLTYVFQPFCQQHLVNFIFRLAAAYLYRIRRCVEVTGYAKNYQKEVLKEFLISFAHRADSWTHDIELEADEEEGGVGKAPFPIYGSAWKLTNTRLAFLNALHLLQHHESEPDDLVTPRNMQDIGADLNWTYKTTKNGTRVYKPIVYPERVPPSLLELNWTGTDFILNSDGTYVSELDGTEQSEFAQLKFMVGPEPCSCTPRRCDQTELPDLKHWVEDINPEDEEEENDDAEQA